MIRKYLLVSLYLLISGSTSVKYGDDTIFYASLNKAIHLGQYEGVITARELKTHGDFGVGSQEKLAGELILLDGVNYTVPADGKASVMPDDARIAFAAVKFFKADKKITFSKKKDIKEIQNLLDSIIDRNAFAAIKISGQFEKIKYRSFDKQEKPYKPIPQVNEIKLQKQNTKATMVGFYTPKSAEVLNSPEYHFHFVDADKSTGGHLNDCIIENGLVEIDYASDLTIDLPEISQFKNIDLTK